MSGITLVKVGKNSYINPQHIVKVSSYKDAFDKTAQTRILTTDGFSTLVRKPLESIVKKLIGEKEEASKAGDFTIKAGKKEGSVLDLTA